MAVSETRGPQLLILSSTLNKRILVIRSPKSGISETPIWVVVKIRVPFWVLIIIRHLIYRAPKKGP